jgi:hypothetical protein
MNVIEVVRFVGPAVPGAELQDAAEAAVREVTADPASRAELARHGLDEETLRGVEFSVEQKPGLDPGSIIIVILLGASSQLTANAIQALWGMVSRRIRKQKGHDALGEKLESR